MSDTQAQAQAAAPTNSVHQPAPAAPATPAPAAPVTGGQDWVPRKRHNDALGKVAEYEAQVKKLTADLDTALALAAGAAAIEGQYKTLQSEFEAFKGQAAQDVVFVKHGIDDEDGIAEARRHYNKLPQEDRPPADEWIAGLKEDPTKAPRTLQVYFDGQQAPAQQAAGGGLQRSKGRVDTQKTQPPAGSVTDAQLQEAQAEFKAGRLSAEDYMAILNRGVASLRDPR